MVQIYHSCIFISPGACWFFTTCEEVQIEHIVMTIVTSFQSSQMLLYLLDCIIYSLMISTQLHKPLIA